MQGTRAQNVIVATLAAFAVGASAYAVWSVGRPHPSLSDKESPTGAAQLADQSAVTGPASETAAQTHDPAPEADDDQSMKPPAPSVDTWVAAWSGEEADLMVVGDGFGNMPNQWVQLWAQLLSSDRSVQIHHWGEAADVEFNEPIVLSDAGGSPLTVWSASRAGSTIHAAAERYGRFVDASTEPDAVLITLGLSSASEDIGAGLDALVGQIEDDIPVLLVIGPEGLYAEGIGDALLTWVERNDDRVSVVDLREVAPVSPTAEQWARAFDSALES